ncbi:Cytochrome P450 [Macleaya cordata]|uniref:Cytochrome P450 n=1 Tax=Macleaya cordata TaxID=56857 RepID=A0A200QND1_MACCD|nr:Cytochrome P450 [Macleaya cordata]
MWSYVVLCLIALATVSFSHYVYRWRNPKCKGGRLPPGSMGFPLIGETIQFFIPSNSLLDVPRFFKTRFSRYGKLFRTSLLGHPIVVSSDPEFNYFILQQERKLVQVWYMDSFSAIFGGTLRDAPDAHIHKYARHTVLNHVGTETLKEKLLLKFEVMANQALGSWSTQPSIELQTSITSMVFNFISMHLFGFDSTKSSENLIKMFSGFFQCFMTFPTNIPGTAFHRCMKNQKKAVKLIKNILYERINSPEKRCHKDFLDQVIEDMKTEEFLTEDFVVYWIFGLFLSSYASTSVTLTLAVTLLTDHPLVVKELRKEQETILRSRENADSALIWKEFKSMTFMPQVINEVLRMSISPLLLRKAMKDIHINGYVIPEGWKIMIIPSAIHMDPDKFTDPFAFNSWRWNDLGPNTSSKNFIPFGGGLRTCVGAEFSKTLMSVFLHVLVTKFRYGKRFRTSLAGRPIVISSDPEFNHYIFQQERKLVQLWYMDSFSAFMGGNIDATANAYIHKYIRNVILNHIGILKS